jgi:hypothetical protein
MSNPFSHQEQVQILMEEYKTLRAEIIQRMASSFQTWGVAGTASVAISGIVAAYSVPIGALLLIMFFLVIWLAWRVVDYDTRLNAMRLRELETTINELAGTRLLVWETNYGTAWPERQRMRFEYVFRPLVAFRDEIRKIFARTST